MRVLLLILFFLCPRFITAEIVWSAKPKPGFAAVIHVSNSTLNVDNKLQISAILVSPKGYSSNRQQLRNNLLNNMNYGTTPFILLAEEAIIQEHNIERVIFTLDPEKPGRHLLTLGLIVFEPDEPGSSESVSFMSGVFEVNVTMNTGDIEYNGLVSSLLPLSTQLPVDISSQNKEEYIKSASLQLEEIAKHRKLFPDRGTSTIAFGILLFVKLGIAFVAFWRFMKKTRIALPRTVLVRSARDKATTYLGKLQEKQYPQQEDYEKYYSGVTGIIRNFIEEAFELRAPTLTTPEFLEKAAAHSEFDEKTKQVMQHFLTEADKVKFALGKSSVEDCHDVHLSAKKIIEELTPKESQIYVSRGVAFFGVRMLLQKFLVKGGKR